MDHFAHKTVMKVNGANPELIGVKIAKICIANKISFGLVADKLKVSRATVYSWFTGRTKPIPVLREKLERLHKQLETQTLDPM